MSANMHSAWVQAMHRDVCCDAVERWSERMQERIQAQALELQAECMLLQECFSLGQMQSWQHWSPEFILEDTTAKC